MTPNNKNPFADLKALSDELNAITTRQAKTKQEVVKFKENSDRELVIELANLKDERNRLYIDMEKLYEIIKKEEKEQNDEIARGLRNELNKLDEKCKALNVQIEELYKKKNAFSDSTKERHEQKNADMARLEQIYGQIRNYDQDNINISKRERRTDSESSDGSGMVVSDHEYDDASATTGTGKHKKRRSPSISDSNKDRHEQEETDIPILQQIYNDAQDNTNDGKHGRCTYSYSSDGSGMEDSDGEDYKASTSGKNKNRKSRSI